MKHKIIYILLMLLTMASNLYAQNTMQSPFELGTRMASFSCSNTLNTANYTNNYSERPTNDVFYKFTLSVPMEVAISHCGSELYDTYMSLLDATGNLVVSPVDDYWGEGCCPNIYHPYMKLLLAAGTYYIVSEGYSQNGNITTTITGTVQNTFDIGTKSANFTYTDTQNTTITGNNHTGRAPNDVFYKFTLTVPMEITAAHCGSGLSDTYLTLLDASKNYIIHNDNYSGEGKCANTYHSYLKRQLTAGTYYIVSEGYSQNGNITTTITGAIIYPYSINVKADVDDGIVSGGTPQGNYLAGTIITLPTAATHDYLGFGGFLSFLWNDAKGLGDTFIMPAQAVEVGTDWKRYRYYFIDSAGGILSGGTPEGWYIERTPIILPTSATKTDYTFAAFTCPEEWEGKKSLGETIYMPDDLMIVTTKWKQGIKEFPIAATPSANQNYIKTRTYTSDDGDYFIDAVQYYDGFGRPTQTTQTSITPNQNDLVALQEYDEFGRESKTWLPAVAQNNKGAFLTDFTDKSVNTYNNTTYNSAADSKPYSYPVYEPSPLNRINEQYGTGNNWHTNGKAVKTDYLTNSSDYPCAYYYIEGDYLKRNNNYGNAQLYVTKMADEERSVSYEFKDKLDRVILQRQMNGRTKHDTYYVYDDFGNLRYVLPPLAADATGNGSYNENSAPIKNYAYVYKYDARNRCIWKQLPGCDPVYYVYDRADRLILSQDGEQRLKNEWIFNKYDAFGRIIISGIYNDSRTHSQLTEVFKDKLIVESVAVANYGYSWNEQPVVASDKVLIVNYYDDYQHLMNQSSQFSQNLNYEDKPEYGKKHINASCSACSAKGLLVGTRVKMTDGSGEIVTAMYYDNKGRIIQKKSTNHLGGFEKEYYAYSFTGQVDKKLHEHSVPGKTTQTETYRYDYDHAERLINTYYKLNNDSEVLMTHNTYDELGRLKTNTPYNLDNFKSTYAYNIRSWITDIASVPYTENLTYFYNGNVETMKWQQIGEIKKYIFYYDGLSRLIYTFYYGQGNYEVSYDYDKHGNITNLMRHGQKTVGNYDVIDDMLLKYNGGNQLKYIEDCGAKVLLTSSYDFKDYSKGNAQEYWYNANGAMTKDLNKGISEIAYNTLGMPTKVDIKSPVAEARNEYLYSADGQKLKVVHKWNRYYSTTPIIGSSVTTGSLTTSKTTDYVGNFIYEYGTLKRILTENGYYQNNNHYFYLKNHLGSNVIAANKNGSIEQNNHYYPFGSMMEDGNEIEQPYKYTGKELDVEHGLALYDYGARQYDPTIGRFLTVDPLAEKYYNISPYAYCRNNPVKYIDPTGLAPIYAPDGTFLGTDEDGLQGCPLILNRADFTQGMARDDAQKVLWTGELTKKARAKMDEHVAGLSSRPDYDGVVSIAEGIAWAKDHPGALNNPTPDNTLYIDAAKCNFGFLSTSDFDEEGVEDAKNLFTDKNLAAAAINPRIAATVYALGAVDMILLDRDKKTVKVVNNSATDYDWNTGGTVRRDRFIRTNNFLTGINPQIHGFKTYYYGIGRLRK